MPCFLSQKIRKRNHDNHDTLLCSLALALAYESFGDDVRHLVSIRPEIR